ncbi:ATP-binding cassette sub-family C member 4-like isoform X2 [Metopolophium dirhodum]|nr:ATP-binding cassette sub-family C member 4-like isoform X2 [Metopolophium dirhodum]
MDSGNKYERPSHPRANANILEILTFGWMYKLFKTGGKRDLEVNDLYATLNDHTSSSLGRELEEKWNDELANAKKANRSPSLTKALTKMFGVKFMLLGLLQSIVEIFLRMSQPLLIGGLLSYFNPNLSNKTHSISHAYTYATLLVLNMLVTLVMHHAIQIEILHCGMKIRVACCSLIFKKALRLSKTALGETTVGQAVNLLSNDVNRFDTVVIFLNYLWIGPLQTILVTYFLWQEIGVSSIIGVAILLMVIPIQGWIGKKISEYRLNTAIRTDERVRLMNEIISGIQVIKMYTWEKPFANFVEYARRKEINEIKGSSYCRAVMLSFMAFHTRVAMVFSIFLYVVLGNYISAQQVFVITSYYNLLRNTMTGFFPQGIAMVAEMLISIKRLQNFLMYDENKNQTVNPSKSDKKAANSNRNIIITNKNVSSVNVKYNDNGSPQLNNIGIVVNNATAKWTEAQTENSLENINLTVIPGRLVGVIGPVGSGKSSLLQAILRELPLSGGKITVHGVVSYASQEPWLFAGSVQQNILFGSTMDAERYKKVIQVCALKTDLEQFQYGDKTVVGERGISLSGGQRARINLARAVYKQADIYLLDDPLSAVDAHVGRHLFRKCIKGYLREKTCILITHQIQYLSSVDQIILMHKGNVLTEGSYQELQKSDLDFTKMLGSPAVETTTTSYNENISKNTSPNNHRIAYSRQKSIQSIASSIEDIQFSNCQEEPAETSETRTSGSVSKNVYSSYFLAGGSVCKILFFFIACIFTQVLASGGDFWMAYWVNLEEHVFYKVKNVSGDPSTKLLWWSISRKTCFIVFGVLTLMMIVGIIIRSITFVSVCMKSSTTLHNNMFSAITRATMSFFNTNSSGRILNRFSKDMGAIDEMLPAASLDCIQIGLLLMSIVIVIGIINFYLMIPTFVIVIIFYKFRVFYLSTSRSVKRLEGVTRSPVFAHFNASLQGLTTIRAYGAEKILSNEFDYHQDLHSSAWYIFICSSRAFGLWLDIVCFIYISIVTFSFLIIGNTTYGGNVGLAITQAISLAGMFQWGMRQSAELENQMTSVERVLEYTNVPQEDALESSPEKKPPTEWPMNGQIIFKNFYLRYGTDSPFVVKNLNINIESMEKVGIVGRTGAGKSSLIGALFRLAINEGNIIIDDIEIHDIGLHELRSKLSIIPQEPNLFSGTMRTNLDPFNEYPDHILWNALDEVELRYIVEGLPNGLNSVMSEGGSNFSVGQRQLVCLARAIVRNNKVLVLDEATANVDPQTDEFIQNTIRNKFRMCTVLTIAHRLNTVIDSDKVLVMDAGAMVEFDHPHNLLKDKNGFLYKMVEQTGPTTAELLHSAASESYNRMISTKEYLIKS